MTMPPTYFDYISNLWPYLIEAASQDARKVLSAPNPPEVCDFKLEGDGVCQAAMRQCFSDTMKKLLNLPENMPDLSLKDIEDLLNRMPNQRRNEANNILQNTHNHFLLSYVFALNHIMSGKKTFHFSDNLSSHLANTEINIKSDLIKLPFPTCQFVFTSKEAINAMHGIRGKNALIGSGNKTLDYNAPISVFLTTLPADNLPGQRLMIIAWHAKAPDKNYLMLKREIYLHESYSLEKSLKTDWEKICPNDDEVGQGLSVDEGASSFIKDDKFYTDGLSFYRIILNAILYLSSDDAELESKTSPHAEIIAKAEALQSPAKRRKQFQKLGRYSALDFFEAGPSVGQIIIQKAADGDAKLLSGSGKPIVRFMVRGHWRNQPYGKALQKNKLIWIRPYYKGPDLADTINKPYLVK